MIDHEWSKCDEFLDSGEVEALVECMLARRERGEFAASQIGGSANRRYRPDLRGDEIAWLQPPLRPAEDVVMGRLETLRLSLNRYALLGLWETEIHYARFAAGTAFARHVDRPVDSTRRVVSFSIYLNQTWQAGDGGELRLYDGSRRIVEMQPLGGRMVSFLSVAREHEVLVTHRERASLSGWFLTRC